MQLINQQYKVVKMKYSDSYGTTYVVEDIQNGNILKHLRVINLQKDTREFIEYMKNNFYDYSQYFHRNLMDFHFFNRIKLIDYKQVSVNQFYYTYDYFESINAFEYCKDKDIDSILKLIAELCSGVKYLHLRGFLLHSIETNDLQVATDSNGDYLKVVAIPYPQGLTHRTAISKCNSYFEAPETVNSANYSILSDVYIIGAVILYMLSGSNGIGGNPANLISLLENSMLDDCIIKIIRKCTETEPEKRFQSVDEIISNVNNCYGKHYNIIEKQYIEAMPQYRLKPWGRYNLIDKILNNAKEHFFIEHVNKASLVIAPEGSGKDNFLETLYIKAEHEGFIPIQAVLNGSDFLQFHVFEVLVKSMTKYVDKELIDKYIIDINNVVSQISQYRAMTTNTEVTKEIIIQRINNFITEASKKFPYIFIIDNFQWIDQDSLELIDKILKNRNNSKTYFVLAADKVAYSQSAGVKEYSRKLKENSISVTITLKSYGLEDTAELIRLILGMDKAPYKFAKVIYDKTKGSPDYIYDMVYMLFSNNIIYVDDKGQWILDKVDDESLTFSYTDDMDMLNSVYKLNSDYQDILKSISIFSMAVSADIVENFVEVKGDKLVNQLNYLSYINILIRNQNEIGISYSFSSINLKKSIYESIDSDLRRKCHEKAAYILKSKFSRDNSVNEDELINQMLKANWHMEVKEYLLSSAKDMVEDSSINQSIQFLEHVYSILSKENAIEEKVLICSKLGELYERIGEFSKAIFHYNIIETVADNSNNPYMMIDICTRKYTILYKLKDTKTALRYLAKAKQLLNTTDYKKGLYEQIIVVNRMMLHKRKFNTYIRILKNVLGEMDKVEYRFQFARILGIYGSFICYKGRNEESLAALKESVRIIEELGNYGKTLHPLNSIGSIYYNYFNDIQKAREYYEKCLSISQRLGDAYYIGISYNNLAELYRTDDNYSGALQFYQNSLNNIIKINDKYVEFLISLNMAQTSINIEDYNKGILILDDMEEEFIRSKYSGNLLDFFYQCRAEFCYAMGEYDKARKYAQEAVEMCINWGITENYEAHFIRLLAEINLSNSLDYEKDKAFIDKVFGENLYKLGRTACVKLAEIYAARNMKKQAEELLQRGLSYVSQIDTDMLRLRYEYVGAVIKEGQEKLERLTGLTGLLEAVENNEIKWMIYKSIASELIEQKNYREALKYLITSLNYLRKLVYNVPDEYKVRFISSHGRDSVKESLTRVSELLTADRFEEINKKTHAIEKSFLNKQKAGISLHELDKYFDYTEYRDIYRYKEMDEVAVSKEEEDCTNVKFLNKIKELVSRFSDDETTNLKNIIDIFAEITQAKNAFIATQQEDGSVNMIASYNRYSEVPFYKYIIEQVKQKKDSITVSDTFDYNTRKGDILIPKDITAVFCIPVAIPRESDSIEPVEERRRYKEQENSTIIGYIYLDTDSIINNFTQESKRFCMMAAKIAYVLVDNYNMKMVSTVDKLTRLYTRKYFESALSSELMYVEKEGGEFSIIMIDIDKFKSVNDRYGHQKGDEVLQDVSSIIMSSVRKGDICGRYGGEEIIVLLPGTTAEGALNAAEKIRKKVENSKLLGLNTSLTISLGISAYPEHGTWAKDLIDKADQALYHVKESGRNGSRIYERDMSKNIKRIDRLAGIISGDLVEDQRKVETMLEILELQRESGKAVEEKMFNFLGRLIEVSEAQTGAIFYIEDAEEGKGRISRKLMRKRLSEEEAEEGYYNENILQKCIDNRLGEYQIDWSSYPGIDSLTGMPDWQSVISVPMTDRGRLRGVVYLSVSIKSKEFDAGTYNYVKTLSDIMVPVLRIKK